MNYNQKSSVLWPLLLHLLLYSIVCLQYVYFVFCNIIILSLSICYIALITMINSEYYIFIQMYIKTILDNEQFQLNNIAYISFQFFSLVSVFSVWLSQWSTKIYFFILRPLLKWVLHHITGKCELLRISYNKNLDQVPRIMDIGESF